MSSKRKKRHAEWLKRQAKRAAKKKADQAREEAMNSGNIEKMAESFGIRLR